MSSPEWFMRNLNCEPEERLPSIPFCQNLNGSGASSLLGLFPKRSQFTVEFFRALFGKENSRAFKLHATFCSRNRIGQPVRPLDVEVDVVGSPDDQSGSLQGL